MIKVLGFILTLLGIVGLVLGVLGIFGTNYVVFNSWAMTILGFVFFVAGIGILKRRRDTDEVNPNKTTTTTTTQRTTNKGNESV